VPILYLLGTYGGLPPIFTFSDFERGQAIAFYNGNKRARIRPIVNAVEEVVWRSMRGLSPAVGGR
jgi:hypothetical protein